MHHDLCLRSLSYRTVPSLSVHVLPRPSPLGPRSACAVPCPLFPAVPFPTSIREIIRPTLTPHWHMSPLTRGHLHEALSHVTDTSRTFSWLHPQLRLASIRRDCFYVHLSSHLHFVSLSGNRTILLFSRSSFVGSRTCALIHRSRFDFLSSLLPLFAFLSSLATVSCAPRRPGASV